MRQTSCRRLNPVHATHRTRRAALNARRGKHSALFASHTSGSTRDGAHPAEAGALGEEADDLRADVLHDGGTVEPQGTGDVALEAGHADAHVGRIAQLL
jgi:hypothetical protein